MLTTPTETTILLAVVGSIGVIASSVVLSYALNRNVRYERKLSNANQALIDELNSATNEEINS
jgi:ClpP class serine protease